MTVVTTDNVQDVLARLPLKDQRLQSILLSNYRKRFPGKGVEFDELQPYHPGDDIRSIDWKSSVRTNSILSRKYIENCDNNLLFMFDTSSSMNSIDSNGDAKIQSALAVFFVLAKTAFANSDKVGIAYRRDGEYKRVPFTGTPSSLMPTLKRIDRTISESYLEEDNWDPLFEHLNSDIKDNTICIVIGDSFDFHLRNLSKLKLACIKHTLIFIEISSWFDSVGLENEIGITDIESGDGFYPFPNNPQLVQEIKDELDDKQAPGVKVTLQARYFKISNLNHIAYDMIKLLSGSQVKFTKTFTP